MRGSTRSSSDIEPRMVKKAAGNAMAQSVRVTPCHKYTYTSPSAVNLAPHLLLPSPTLSLLPPCTFCARPNTCLLLLGEPCTPVPVPCRSSSIPPPCISRIILPLTHPRTDTHPQTRIHKHARTILTMTNHDHNSEHARVHRWMLRHCGVRRRRSVGSGRDH